MHFNPPSSCVLEISVRGVKIGVKADDSQGALNLIHRDRANILFADGHCGTLTKETAYASGYSTCYYNEEKTACTE